MQVKFDSKKFRSRCSISCTLDLLGDKWSLVVMRNAIFLGCKTYGDFQKTPEKIATNILADRLKKLVSYGIFEKKQNKSNGLKYDYILSESGKALEPILRSLGDWGHKYISETTSLKEALINIKKEQNK